MGIKDQYIVEWPRGSQQYQKPGFKDSLQLLPYDETKSIQMDRYRYQVLLDTTEVKITNTMVKCLQGIHMAKGTVV
jgi:hypothetical protein